MKKILRTIDSIARDYFAGYIVCDEMGTHILCWTMDEAFSWLSFCGKNAKIVESYDYKVLVSRTQGA